jgi:hypothetical protein
MTGPNSVDRSKSGSTIRVLSDRPRQWRWRQLTSTIRRSSGWRVLPPVGGRSSDMGIGQLPRGCLSWRSWPGQRGTRPAIELGDEWLAPGLHEDAIQV